MWYWTAGELPEVCKTWCVLTSPPSQTCFTITTPFGTRSAEAIIGITVAILVVVFSLQGFGSELVGYAYAPVIIIWLVFNAATGFYNFGVYGGSVFKGLSPAYIVDFFIRNGSDGWAMLGGVMLCITGAEAMFADMGHFSRPAIAVRIGTAKGIGAILHLVCFV